MSTKRVAVVTGSNKGVGFGVVRALCKQFDGDVYLTSRDEGRGKQAVAELGKEGLKPCYHQLDIDDPSSVQRLHDFLKSNYGGLDVLVNNAAIAYKVDSTAPFAEQAEVTVKTNFTSLVNVCKTLFPLLRPHARVVNVSSMASQMAITRCSEELKAQFKDKNITLDKLENLMQDFVKAAKEGQAKERGWPESSYFTSKLGVTVLTFIQAREFKKDSRPDIVVNACCPGYVDTDMSSHKGTKTIDQGADTPAYLALLPPNTTSPVGEFVSDRTIKNWG